MEDEYLLKIWNSNDHEADDFLVLDVNSFESEQLNKAKLKLRSLLLPKIIGIVLGLAWMSFMALLIYYCLIASPTSAGKVFFVTSLGLILLDTGFIVFLYVRDFITIVQIDNRETVTVTQQKLAELQLSIIKSVRISWLQLPFYTTWYLNSDMFVNWNITFWTVQIIVTGLTFWFAVWAFRNINYKNLEKKRVRNFMQGYGFNSVTQAMDFMKEIDDFKNVSEGNQS